MVASVPVCWLPLLSVGFFLMERAFGGDVLMISLVHCFHFFKVGHNFEKKKKSNTLQKRWSEPASQSQQIRYILSSSLAC